MFLKANLGLASRLGLSKNALRLLNCNIRSKAYALSIGLPHMVLGASLRISCKVWAFRKTWPIDLHTFILSLQLTIFGQNELREREDTN